MNDGTRKIIYPHLPARRDELGLTDAQVAAHAKMKKSKWRGLLTGKCFASPSELQRLCEILQLPPEEFPHLHRPRGSGSMVDALSCNTSPPAAA